MEILIDIPGLAVVRNDDGTLSENRIDELVSAEQAAELVAQYL